MTDPFSRRQLIGGLSTGLTTIAALPTLAESASPSGF